MVSDDRLEQLREATYDPVRWAFLMAAHLLGAGRASLLLRDPSSPVLVPSATLGFEPTEASGIRVQIGRGIAGVVAERGVTLIGESEGSVFLSVPITTSQGVEGVLNLTDRQNGRQFGEADMPLATAVAAHIAYLLERTRRPVEVLPDGLVDRAVFDDLLDRELARSRRTGEPLAIAVLHLANPQLLRSRGKGHDIDAFLRQSGSVIARSIRRYDVVCSLGRETFALLVHAGNGPDAAILQRVTEAVTALAAERGIAVECQVGLARCPEDAIGAAELLAIAEGKAKGQA